MNSKRGVLSRTVVSHSEGFDVLVLCFVEKLSNNRRIKHTKKFVCCGEIYLTADKFVLAIARNFCAKDLSGNMPYIES